MRADDAQAQPSRRAPGNLARSGVFSVLAAAVVLFAGAAWSERMAGTSDAAEAGEWRWEIPGWLPPPPVPADNPMSSAKVDLGRHLFYDARLSADGTIACSSCHIQAHAFADARPRAVGVGGVAGHRNAMSLANAGYLPVLGWANPHLRSLEFQALLPLFGTDPLEMGLAGADQRVLAELSGDPVYGRLVLEAFPDRGGDLDLFAVTRALAAFQRSLVSANSSYDRYKRGGAPDAITAAAKRGEELFFSHRLECYHCHGGFNFTDTVQTSRMPFPEVGFHNTGLHDVDGRGSYPPRSVGLVEHTGRPEDMGRFRTPSLRNVAVTAPYMHDGSIASLEEVIDHYARGGRAGPGSPWRDPLLVGFRIDDRDRADLIAFLESLTDHAFLSDPRHADPWPADHPARAERRDSPR